MHEQNNTVEKAELGVAGKDDRSFNRIASMATLVISSMLAVVCIIILYFLPVPLHRLVVILVFTIIFAVTITLVTEARRVEVFAACAA